MPESRTSGQPAELDGIRVLVTRAGHQQQKFSDRLIAHGATPVSLPCLEIRPVTVSLPDKSQLQTADAIVFTSTNAVALADEQGLLATITDNRVYSVGPATAAALERRGLKTAHPPESPYNSESLWAVLSRQQQNLQKVAIVKGCGGRSFLQQTLRQYGIKSQIINVYQRVCPAYTEGQRAQVFLNSGADIVTITSNDALENLVAIAGQRYQPQLFSLPLIVNSDRGADLARSLGFQSQIFTARVPGDTGQLDAIKKWNRSCRSNL